MAQPIYLVVDVKIDDAEAYGKYKEKVKPLIESYGGEYLSRGGEINVLENELWEPTRMVLVKFPDKESAINWYNCEEYQALKKIRIDNATSTSFFIFSFFEPLLFKPTKFTPDRTGLMPIIIE